VANSKTAEYYIQRKDLHGLTGLPNRIFETQDCESNWNSIHKTKSATSSCNELAGMTIRRIETQQDCESITNSSSSHSTGYVERKGSPQSDRIAEPYIRNTGLRIESEFHSLIASTPSEPTGLSIRIIKTQDCESANRKLKQHSTGYVERYSSSV
jgi:hypothetical protein